MYSDQKSLATHVSDHHEKTERPCPICPNKIYTSEGGYYTHMRNAHKIGRNGKKLSQVVDEQERENQNDTEKEEENGEISDSQNKPIPKKKKKKSNSSKSSKRKSDEESEGEEPKKKKSKMENASNPKGSKTKPTSKNVTLAKPLPNTMVYHCPFSTCKDLAYEDEAKYFEHLFTFHKLEGKK